MKVLLIHPKCKTEEISHLQIPLGLCYIASYIRKKHDVMIYDEPVEKKSLKKLIDNFNPDVIGFSFTTQSAYRAYQLVKELKIIVNKHNQKLVQFFDDTFTVNHKFVKDFCKLIIDSKLKFTWSVQARVDTIQNDFEMLELLEKAGCKLIIFGIESGSEKILKRINKNITIQQMEDAINLTKKAKIDVKTTWIVGLPGNFSEQIESLDLMKRLKPNQITIHLCVPYFGTDLYEKRKEFGIWINDKVKSKDLYNFNPSYYENNDLNKFFKYSYISFGDIFKIAKKMKSEMQKVGYISPNEYKSGDEKTIKTFLDKVKNPLIKKY